MKDSTKVNIITVVLFILAMFVWWLSGYDFGSRGKSVAEQFFSICGFTAVAYITLPFLIRVYNNNNKKDN